ncbi:MAG: hypothetical protein KIH02_01865 [Parabacteroides sp.]|nr:hypothetical protein [Parabacteroides sp.]
MNSIYTRANPDYSNLINAAIKNRMDFEKQQSKYREGIVKAGQDAIGVIGRGIETWEGMSDEEKELERLKAENEDINNRYSEYLSESNSTGKDYWTNQMQGYKPNVIEQPRVRNPEGNAYALPGDPNATQADYFNYIQAMNGIYGG